MNFGFLLSSFIVITLTLNSNYIFVTSLTTRIANQKTFSKLDPERISNEEKTNGTKVPFDNFRRVEKDVEEPSCGIVIVDKKWLKKREKWNDVQFVNELNFDGQLLNQTEKSPCDGGLQFASFNLTFNQNLIPIEERNCQNRSGGESNTFFSFWFNEVKDFTIRELRSIESVFYHNPKSKIKIYSNSLSDNFFNNLTILGCQIEILKINFEQQSLLTPLLNLTKRLDYWKQNDKFYDTHIKEALKYLIMYSNGGIFFELDSYFMNSVNHFHNVIGIEEDDKKNVHLSSHLYTFDSKNQFIWKVMEVFASKFEELLSSSSSSSSSSLQIGEEVLTQVYFEDIFNTTQESIVNIVPVKAFSFFSKNEIKDEFEMSKFEKVNEKIKHIRSESLAARMWSEITSKIEIFQVSVAYNLMNQFCLVCNVELK